MPKKFLSKEILDRYINENHKTRNFIRNPEKRQLFKDIINSNFLKRKGNESRITAFNRQWNKAQRISRLIYGKENISQRSKISANFVRENTFYRSSFMSNFRYSKKIEIEKSVHNAEYKTYEERTKNFMNKYGEMIVKGEVIKGLSGLTLNEYLEMYKNGEISKDDMNEVIDFFKTDTDYYKGQVGSD